MSKLVIDPNDKDYDSLKRIAQAMNLEVEDVTNEPAEPVEAVNYELESKDEIKPEANITPDFLKAQLSTRNQAVMRNILAVVSAIVVLISYVLEKLGIL